jgi:nucleoid-associated protein YgaU
MPAEVAMNRAVLVITAIVLIPVLIAVGYFGPKLFWSKGRGGEGGAAASADSGRVEVPPGPGSPPPPVEGPTLRPEAPKGQVVEGPLVPDSSAGRYRVRDGDTLYAIAVQKYGDASYVQDILQANRGLTSRIVPGQEIRLPPRREEASAAPAQEQPKIYVVQHGETLISIARRLYGDSAMYVKIFELNRDKLTSPDRVPEGTVLRLPPPPKYE